MVLITVAKTEARTFLLAILLLQGGDALQDEAKKLVAAMAGRPFIFNLGHGVMQPTPPEHVAELVKAIRS